MTAGTNNLVSVTENVAPVRGIIIGRLPFASATLVATSIIIKFLYHFSI